MMSQESGSSGEKLSCESGEDQRSSEDEQITRALEEYAELKRAGRLPPRAEFLARHARIAEALAECLDGLEFVEDAASHFARRPGRSASADGLSLPAQLGEFRLIREIGRGGTGVVFEAEDLTAGTRVALKVLPSGASLDSQRRLRFQSEAQAAGFLRHEHIVPVYGTGYDAGVHYSVMQLIDGRPLSDVFQELKTARERELSDAAGIDLPDLALPVVGSAWRLSVRRRPSGATRRQIQRAVRWAVQAADALEHAHQLGIVHRGIKPSNLLIDRRGRLWVTDFGLARLTQRHDEVLSEAGAAVLRYMGPEQLRGSRPPIDARTDIYALGVALYELLTLQPAHTGHSTEELRARIAVDLPTPPRRLNASIARDLETVVLKAMEKDPAARYASARELAADLRRFLADQPVRAQRPSVLEQSLRLARRHRRAAITVASTALIALAANLIGRWSENRNTITALDELRRLEMRERAALDNALGAIDQITLAAVASRQDRSEIALYTGLPTGRLHSVSFSQVWPNAYAQDDDLLALVAQAQRRAGRSRLILGDPRGRDDFRRAIRIYEELVLREPARNDLRLALIDTLREFGGEYLMPIGSVEARASTVRALELNGLLSVVE